MNGSKVTQGILEKLAAYFAGCSDNFISEGQEFALPMSQRLRTGAARRVAE